MYRTVLMFAFAAVVASATGCCGVPSRCGCNPCGGGFAAAPAYGPGIGYQASAYPVAYPGPVAPGGCSSCGF